MELIAIYFASVANLNIFFSEMRENLPAISGEATEAKTHLEVRQGTLTEGGGLSTVDLL
jgi:hypothetical protein